MRAVTTLLRFLFLSQGYYRNIRSNVDTFGAGSPSLYEVEPVDGNVTTLVQFTIKGET